MVQSEVSSPHSMIVDQTGVRYMREAQSYMQFCQEMLARNKIAPAIPSWLVMDSRFLSKYMVANTFPGLSKPQEWFDSGFLVKGETLQQDLGGNDGPAAPRPQPWHRPVREGIEPPS